MSFSSWPTAVRLKEDAMTNMPTKSKPWSQDFVETARRAQRLANMRGGDYAALTFDELCEFMVEYDRILDKAENSLTEG